MSVVVVTFNRSSGDPPTSSPRRASRSRSERPNAPTDSGPFCELRGVQKWFDRRTGNAAARSRGHQPRAPPNEVVASSGPSGCGKSTMLRILRRADRAEQGRGALPRRAARAASTPGVAIVFQSFALFPWMTVTENIEAVLRRAGSPTPRTVRERARKAIRDGRPRRLRGGLPARALGRHEAARRHGARALASTPRCSSWTSRSARSTRSPPRACGPRSSTSGRAGEEPVVDRDGQPRHQGSRLHGRPHRRPRRQPGPRPHGGREPPAAPARLPLAGAPAPRRPAPRHHHGDRDARRSW